MRCWPARCRSRSAAVIGGVQSRHRAGWCRQALTPACPLQSGFFGGGLIDGPPAAGGWLLRLLLPFLGTTLLISARCAAKGAAPSWKCRAQLVGFGHLPARHPHTRRYPILSVPPLLAFQGTVEAGYLLACISMMALQNALEGVGQRWPRRAINSFQNLQKTKNALGVKALLVFPCCRAGATPLVRWAFLFLASRFASPPYKPQGLVLCEASPAALPLIPSGRVRREYTTMA